MIVSIASEHFLHGAWRIKRLFAHLFIFLIVSHTITTRDINGLERKSQLGSEVISHSFYRSLSFPYDNQKYTKILHRYMIKLHVICA